MEKYTVSRNKKMIISSLLLAMFIILDRLITINTQTLAINLSLLPVMIAGMILGWKYAAIVGGFGDLIGAIFWPFGAYFPGFTLSNIIAGVIFGIFLYENPNKEKKYFTLKAVTSTAIVLGVINLLLNSLWLKIMYGKAFVYYLGIRLLTQIIVFPIYVATIVVLEKSLKNPVKKYLYKREQQ